MKIHAHSTDTRRLCAVLLTAASAIVLSCARQRDRSSDVLVLCGGSMRSAMEEIKRRYEITSKDRIAATYGGSGELCAQIQNAGKGDLYLCHDPFMQWAAERGLIGDWTTVAALDVVIVVPRGNPKNIWGFEELGTPGLRLGVGDQNYSTSGQIVKQLLRQRSCGPAVSKNIRLETKGHQQRCNDVVLGTLDAAIVWNAVAKVYADRLDVVPIDLTGLDAITSATYKKTDPRYTKVTIGLLPGAAKKESSLRFYRYVSGEGKKVFAELGYSPAREGEQ